VDHDFEYFLNLTLINGDRRPTSNGYVSKEKAYHLMIPADGSELIPDLSLHNPSAQNFFCALGKNTWHEVRNPDDCSAARGIGLAVANGGFLSGLIAQTVRVSDQPGKCGDNLLLFAGSGCKVEHTALERAMFFDKADGFETFPSAFTAQHQ
jgi:hypothetical protein